ncbi:MAG: ATP-dependent DNA helicase RecG [Acidobacteriota bacterium]
MIPSQKLKVELSPATSLQHVKGVGSKTAEEFKKAGYSTVEELLYYLPFRYEDRRSFVRLIDLKPGMKVPILGRILSTTFKRIYRGRLTIFEALIDDGTASIKVIWFNQPYLRNIIKEGRTAIFYGKTNISRYGARTLQIENPEFEFITESDKETIHSGRIVPIYQRIGKMSTKKIRNVIYEILGKIRWQIPEILPLSIIDRYSLLPRYDSLRGVHFPPGDVPLDDLNMSKTSFHRRLIFEEFFFLQLGLAMRRKAVHQEVRGIKYSVTDELRRKLASIIPFRLTEAQRRALKEIGEDLKSSHPMNRLLQGDVGCGKTIVALLGMIVAVENGYQAALMAPTEILSEQHYFNVKRLTEKTGLRVELLTSSIKGRERSKILSDVASGRSQIIIGTHALIQEGVQFKKLGLAIIDEQHRFGVLQRSNLIEKGLRPDTLIMTATPIPRSLALTVYGDLDISIIDQLPPGRTPIKTFVRDERAREKIYDFVRSEVRKGRQAYIVYPIIDESEKLDLRAAKKMWEQLSRTTFREFTVGLMHGRLKPEEKEKVMSDFAGGATNILVSTTVIEVGIDIKNATIMIIEHAERYGLSQLHQLRGRVGRGGGNSYCILLVGGTVSEEAMKRLEVMESSVDGFYIAEKDLEIRGPGEFMGTKQSGIPDLRVGNIVRDQLYMKAAREEAFSYIERASEKEDENYRKIMYHLNKRWGAKLGLITVG